MQPRAAGDEGAVVRQHRAGVQDVVQVDPNHRPVSAELQDRPPARLRRREPRAHILGRLPRQVILDLRLQAVFRVSRSPLVVTWDESRLEPLVFRFFIPGEFDREYHHRLEGEGEQSQRHLILQPQIIYPAKVVLNQTDFSYVYSMA